MTTPNSGPCFAENPIFKNGCALLSTNLCDNGKCYSTARSTKQKSSLIKIKRELRNVIKNREDRKKMKYALLQAPNLGNYLGQIEIVLDKRRMKYLLDNGYSMVGWIESDLKPTELQNGFRSDADMEIDQLWSIAQGYIFKQKRK